MKRENRYLVIKHKDADKYLTRAEKERLHDIAKIIKIERGYDEKPPLECVVVESSWPEYEPTWAAIAQRVDRGARNV